MTIYDIAKEARTSPASVSRYLNNIKIKEETSKRIEAVLKKYNFTPSAVARGLASNSSKTIGVILIDIRLPHYANTAYFLENEFRQIGYNIIICNTHGSIEETKASINNLLSYHVDGICFFGSVFTKLNEDLEILNLLKDIPIITLNFSLSVPHSYSLMIADGYGIEISVEHLYNKHRKNIFLIYDSDTTSSNEKIKGFKQVMQRLSLNWENHIIKVMPGVEGGYTVLEKLLNSNQEFDGIVCAEDTIAVGVVNSLQDAGYVVGKDVDVIGFNNSIYAKITMPNLTSVDTQAEYQAHMVAQMLQSLISSSTPISSMTYKPNLVVRESA